jgi:hypothetical protein
MSSKFKTPENLRGYVLDAVRAGHDTLPLIRGHVERTFRTTSDHSDPLTAAYLAHTSSAQDSTRRAVYELLDACILRRAAGGKFQVSAS